MGNQKIYKDKPQNEFLKEATAFYNVKKDDPELMTKLHDFTGSTSIFHAKYLEDMLAERNVSYSKVNPNAVGEPYFLEKLIERSQKTKHIQSFQYFIDFCKRISSRIQS